MSISRLAMVIMISAFSVAAGPREDFQSWDDLIKKSPDIFIARCTTTPQPRVLINGGPQSEVKIMSVLKGKTKPGSGYLVSDYWPRQGERMLVFSTFGTNLSGTVYLALESFRVVPLGLQFNTNLLDGKSSDEQISFLLKYRLKRLNQELKEGTEEKKRLEEAVQK